MQIVTETRELAKLTKALARDAFVTVDTEFIRDTTYWPQLCLIQIAGADHEAIIDPLAKELDLAPFFELMANYKVIKVFHAARQDLEIFFHQAGNLPQPLFDTQIAAMVCGFGDQVGYETLVRKVLDKPLDKSSRFTDWSRRPLSDKQLNYALGDVTHLRPIYESLSEQVEKADRHHWMAEEMAVLTSPGTYNLTPEDAWKRLKIRSGNKRYLAILMEIAAWRESEAQSRNVPRNRVLKDDALMEIAAHAPSSEQDLSSLRGVPNGFGRSSAGKTLVQAVKTGLDRDPKTLPKVKRNEPQPSGIGPLVELFKVLLKAKSENHQVAPRMIATVADLEKIAADDEADVAALKGWRREVFGADALDLKHGNMALTIRKNRVVLIPFGENKKRDAAE